MCSREGRREREHIKHHINIKTKYSGGKVDFSLPPPLQILHSKSSIPSGPDQLVTASDTSPPESGVLQHDVFLIHAAPMRHENECPLLIPFDMFVQQALIPKSTKQRKRSFVVVEYSSLQAEKGEIGSLMLFVRWN